MSPSTWSHSGLMVRLSSSICPDRSVSVMSKWRFRWEALFPPPLPSSRTVRIGRPAASASSPR